MNLPLFSLRNITREFPAVSGDKPFMALSGICLDIHEGQCMVIAGSNGSGKTILMRIVSGLLEPSGGDVLFRGQPLYDPGVSASARRRAVGNLRRELGIVFQDADSQIVGETVIEDAAFGPENLGYTAAESVALAEKALAVMGLSEKRDSPPRRLSGGEKRRLAVAGILAMGCGTVIMDEPFANLDWPGVVQVLGIIRDLKSRGKTLVVLTHELEKVLSLAERLVILHGGAIRAGGSPAAVLDGLDPAWGVRDPRRNYAGVSDCSWLEE